MCGGAPTSRVPDGAAPFVFPLAVRDKARALRRLQELGVRGVDLWSVPHPSLDVDEHPEAAELRRTVVGLPVHQHLRPRDLDTVARAALSAAS